jgi:hypothetical protein
MFSFLRKLSGQLFDAARRRDGSLSLSRRDFCYIDKHVVSRTETEDSFNARGSACARHAQYSSPAPQLSVAVLIN